MGQGALKAIADLKVGPKTQHSMDFGVTLHDNIPQEGGGFGIGLNGYQSRTAKHGERTHRERMTLQTDLDDTMNDGEDKVTDGQLGKCDSCGLTFGIGGSSTLSSREAGHGSRKYIRTKSLYLSKTKRGAGIRMERMLEKGRLPQSWYTFRPHEMAERNAPCGKRRKRRKERKGAAGAKEAGGFTGGEP